MVSQRARRVFLGVMLAAVLLAVGGLIGASFVKSPAELAASTRPPAPAVLTAPVVHVRLASTVTLRGAVRASREVTVTPAAEQGATTMVVTAVRIHRGQEIRAGQVLLAVSGRPLYVLPGRFPAYRDMAAGDQGPDVAELQAALQSLGYATSPDPAGTFGTGTEAAVRAFYQAIGYPDATAGGQPGARATGQAATPEVPMSEVAFVPRLPAEVIAVHARVGSSVSSPLVTLASGGLTVTGQLGLGQRGLVRRGMRVTVSDSLTGFSTAGAVTAIGGVTGAASGSPYLPVTVRAGRIPVRELGASVAIQVTAARTAGTVLAVPEAAITTNVSGQTFVRVIGPGGKEQQVFVSTGVSASGMVAVTPRGGHLVAGDRVVTGQ